jgi:hypothetical protein
MSCAGRYKVLLSRRELAFRAAVDKLLNDTEAIVVASMSILASGFVGSPCHSQSDMDFCIFHLQEAAVLPSAL